jgi:hypothetical protein
MTVPDRSLNTTPTPERRLAIPRVVSRPIIRCGRSNSFADVTLAELSAQFDVMYAADGQRRPSIPPKRLLKASLSLSLFSVRSERAFC